MTTCMTEIDDAGNYSNTLNTYLNPSNTSTYKIDGCKRYGYIDNKTICRECETTHIITLDYKCLSKTTSPNDVNLPNCIKAEK